LHCLYQSITSKNAVKIQNTWKLATGSWESTQGRAVKSLGRFQARLDGALRSLIWVKIPLLAAGGLG